MGNAMSTATRASFATASVVFESFLAAGCTNPALDVRATVAADFPSINKGVERVGVAAFSFDRPERDQVGHNSVVRPGNAGELVADAAGQVALALGYDLIDRITSDRVQFMVFGILLISNYGG